MPDSQDYCATASGCRLTARLRYVSFTLQYLEACLAQNGILLRCLSAAKIESATGLASTAEPSKVK